jgi:hypothetical protein
LENELLLLQVVALNSFITFLGTPVQHLSAKIGLNMCLLEMAQNTITLGLSRSISTMATGFLDYHIRVLCLLTFPDK